MRWWPRILDRPIEDPDDPDFGEFVPQNLTGWLLLVPSLLFAYVAPIIGIVMLIGREWQNALLAFGSFAILGVPLWATVLHVASEE